MFIDPDSESDGATDAEEVIEKYYSYKIQFQFTGKNAVKVEWNFGDGSSKIDNDPMNSKIVHIYAKVGLYEITQTAWNSSGLDSTETWKIRVMGPPVISFDSMGGTDIAPIKVPFIDGVPQSSGELLSPERNWYDFTGWYTDRSLTEKWDTDKPVTEHVTLYAGWNFDYLSDEMIILMVTSLLAIFSIIILTVVSRKAK